MLARWDLAQAEVVLGRLLLEELRDAGRIRMGGGRRIARWFIGEGGTLDVTGGK